MLEINGCLKDIKTPEDAKGISESGETPMKVKCILVTGNLNNL